jgi:chromosome segregation ATPase
MITEIKFQCANCGQRISVEADAAGLEAPCPTCHNPLRIPAGDEPNEPAAKREPAPKPREAAHGEPKPKKPPLRQQLADARAECEQLCAEAMLAQAEIRNLQSERLNLRSEVAVLGQRSSIAESKLASLQNEFDLQRQRIEATATQLAAMESERAAERAEAAATASKLAAAEVALADLRPRLAAAHAEIEKKSHALSAAEADARAVEQTIAEIESRLAASERAEEEMRDQCAAARGETDSLRGLLDRDATSRELLAIREQLCVAEAERANLRTDVSRLESELESVSAERARLDASSAELRRQAADALRIAERSSEDAMHDEIVKLRALIERQNAELKDRFREIARYRRARLAVRIIWSLAVLGVIGLGYLFIQILPQLQLSW